MQKTSVDRTELTRLCRHHGIVFTGLFGSEARDEAGEESDVDLLVRFGERKTLLDLVRVEREIGEALGRPVDLVTENALSQHLADRVMDDLIVLLDDD